MPVPTGTASLLDIQNEEQVVEVKIKAPRKKKKK